MIEKILVLAIFVACYGLAISRKVRLAYISLASAGLLIILGLVPFQTALLSVIKWDVLGIYWGFMMVSMIFSRSGIPALVAQKAILHFRQEGYVIFALCAMTAFVSCFMENVGAVLMMAPLAIEAAKRTGSKLFPYMVAIAISANAVTTVTMIADPPSLILAIETGMKFLDFYWFQGRVGLGAISAVGVGAALLSLLLIFRGKKKRTSIKEEKIAVDYVPLLIFVAGVVALAAAPYLGVSLGVVGVGAGLVSLAAVRKEAGRMMREFDWNSFFFIMGIFVVVGSLEISGLLSDFVGGIGGLGISSAPLMLAIVIWLSVGASSFMDNVPFTVLMIPVCEQLAAMMSISPFPLLFGMLVGTGIGGNLTPVGATANVFAMGMVEKHGEKVRFGEYLKISLPFSLTAVVLCHVLIQLLWL